MLRVPAHDPLLAWLSRQEQELQLTAGITYNKELLALDVEGEGRPSASFIYRLLLGPRVWLCSGDTEISRAGPLLWPCGGVQAIR